MKQCPECKRVYYDEKLNFCLDDGEWLFEVPDESATAVLSGGPSSEAPTRLHNEVRDTARSGDIAEPTRAINRLRSRTALTALLVLAAVVAGVFLYGYFRSGTKHQINSIAVMPFTNETGNVDAEYLSDGMTDSLISSLAGLPNLSVKARSSVFRYKGKDVTARAVGKELSVQGLVLGRVMQRGSDVALHIELVDANSENVLWGKDYSRPTTNLVGLQSEIARDVANNLRARLTTTEEKRVTRNFPANSEAYELYLKGRYFATGKYTEESLRKAIDYYGQALEKDPAYALAYVGLARAYMGLGQVWGFRPPRETFPLAKSAITKALEIDDTLAEAHSAAAECNLSYDWNWSEAEREINKALELNPNDGPAHAEYGTFYQGRGKYDEAASQRSMARDIEPLSPLATANVGYPIYYAGRYEEAIRHFRKALELDPNFAWSYLWIGQAQLEEGNSDDAINNIQKAIALSDGNVRMNATLGYAYAKIGKRAEAERIIEQLRTKSQEMYISPYFIAVIYAGLDEKDLAFEWLEKAFAERHPYLVLMGAEPVFKNLRSDPRFQSLKARIGLP
jgi:TolB-like protein/Flp pilus assembly protein TadD